HAPYLFRYLVLFFFFQAEDGIRVFHVTGVQTCALPISSPPASTRRPPLVSISSCSEVSPCWWPPSCGEKRQPRPWPGPRRSGPRSEERRVGREGRARGGGGACRDGWAGVVRAAIVAQHR